ncbi:MAG TPA: hypothetical protein DCG19_00405 [Cryomorphaceae bacterium]|nr:hypothetical protein [Owenweeksia sp.]MBF97710.1 hypothetical protein [Owenweeksia sp.]HAD95829.1 hypothetical protein [Cryomorphaceae bacterium]|tara:strand:- start:19759 stop:22176 length:2418 start_codon:yes stop_codon:yes gene_type:complete
MTTILPFKKRVFRASVLLLFISLGFVSAIRAQDDTLKIMGYNLLQYPGSTMGRADDYLKDILKYVKPDVFVVNEITNETGANYILSNALNQDGITHYEKAVYTGNNSLNNMAYYNSDKLVLLDQDIINTTPRETDGYRFYLRDPNLPFHQDTVFLTVYVAHLKASQGYESTRGAAATTIRNYLDAKNDVSNHFIIGDFNVYNSTEAAYQTFLGSGNCQFHDPIDESGIWHANSDFEDIHTQSTRTTSFGGGATGGVDDRFDFILCTNDALLGSNHLTYISESYAALGNDGNHFNTSLIASPTNTLYPDSLVQDLYYMSDHLPVIASFAVSFPEGPSTGAGPCEDLFFSEYIEGSGYDRALEIWNPTALTVDLTDYQIEFYPDGESVLTPGHTLGLSGTLGANSSWVVGAASASAAITSVSNLTSSLLDSLLSGNDAVALVNIASGDTLDIIGRIGEDPGASGWMVGAGTTVDYTLIREHYIQKGSPNWAFSADHWIVESIGFTDSLGGHSFYSCNPENECSDLFISEYVRASGGNTAIEVYNPSANPVVLNGSYQLRMYPNGSSSSYYASDLQGVVYPGDVFVIAPFTANLSGIVNNKDQTDASFPGSTFFTGDDAIALFRGYDTLDIVGVIGTDPGSSWPVSGTNGVAGATASYTLVRDSAVQQGQLYWNTGAASEWVVYPNNEDAYLGEHYMKACDAVEEAVTSKQAVASNRTGTPYKVSIYPNPVNEELRIDLRGGQNTDDEVVIYATSTAGHVVWMDEGKALVGTGFSTSVDVSSWPAGFYIVTVKSNQFKGSSHKIMILH